MQTATVFTLLRCSHNCGFCDVRRPRDDADFVRPTRIREAVRAAYETGAQVLVLSGGEPTLDDRLCDHVAYARKLGFADIVVETNGMRLRYPEYPASLASAGLGMVRVAVNAPGTLHDTIAKFDGALEHTVAGVARAAAAGLRVEASVPLVVQNLEAVGSLPAFFRERMPTIESILLRVVVTADPSFAVEYDAASGAVAALSESAAKHGLALRFDTRHAIPRCLTNGRDFEALYHEGPPRDGHGYRRVDACEGCAARPRCPGIQGAYLDRFGEGGVVAPVR